MLSYLLFFSRSLSSQTDGIWWFSFIFIFLWFWLRCESDLNATKTTPLSLSLSLSIKTSQALGDGSLRCLASCDASPPISSLNSINLSRSVTLSLFLSLSLQSRVFFSLDNWSLFLSIVSDSWCLTLTLVWLTWKCGEKKENSPNIFVTYAN